MLRAVGLAAALAFVAIVNLGAPGATAASSCATSLVVDYAAGTSGAGAVFSVTSDGTRTVLSDFGDTSQGPVGAEPLGATIGPDGTIYAIDPSAGGLGGFMFAIDPSSGVRTAITDFRTTAQGPRGINPFDVAVGGDGTLYVVDAQAGATFGSTSRGVLFAVNPDTGARSILSDFGVSSQGPLGREPNGVAIADDGGILVVDRFEGGLFEVDPTTGARTLVSNFADSGQGPLPQNPTDLAIAADGTVYVVAYSGGTADGPQLDGRGALYAVDPGSGMRTLVNDFGDPSEGPIGEHPFGVAVAGNLVLVIDHEAAPGAGGALFAVDPATGFRAMVSNFNETSQGPIGSSPIDVEVVASTVDVNCPGISDPGPPPSASPTPTPIPTPPPGPDLCAGDGCTVFGAGHYDYFYNRYDDPDDPRQIANSRYAFNFTATSDGDGTDATGRFTFFEGASSGEPFMSGRVTCLDVRGEFALVGGHIESGYSLGGGLHEYVTFAVADDGRFAGAFYEPTTEDGMNYITWTETPPDCDAQQLRFVEINGEWMPELFELWDGAIEIHVTGDPTPAVVVAEGTQLTSGGEPYTFTGMNVYNVNNRVHWCWYPMDSALLQQSFADMGDGVEVIRGWFFQDFATTSGQRDWTAFDETIAAAEAAGMKLIVTLGNHWGDCDTEGEKTATWYQEGYGEKPASLPASYRDYVAEVVARYADEPTVLMWQLLNEAEVPLHTQAGLCDPVTHQILKSWAADVSGLIKSLDPFHLVSIGTIGSGQCGAQYTDYKLLHDLPTVDVCEFHDYGTQTMPGDQWNGLAFRIQQCNELDKPLFVGETGIDPRWLDGTLEARAELFRDKLVTQFEAGVVGEVVWAWNAFESRTDTYDIGPGDPVLDVLVDPWAPPDPDADDDGVHDDIDTGAGTFDDDAGTTGSITDAAGHAVMAAPDPDGVRLTVTGTGTEKASFTVCGLTLRLAPGSEVVVSCGSLTVTVVTGAAEVTLADGLTLISIPAGVSAIVDQTDDGGFSLEHLAGSEPIELIVDGVSSQLSPGESTTLQTWDFTGFAGLKAPPLLNTVNPGRTVPLRWRLLDGDGRPVTDLSEVNVWVESLPCAGAGTTPDLARESAAGRSGLRHLGKGNYAFSWKTPRSYANSCKTLHLDVGDGVTHTVLFRFSRGGEED